MRRRIKQILHNLPLHVALDLLPRIYRELSKLQNQHPTQQTLSVREWEIIISFYCSDSLMLPGRTYKRPGSQYLKKKADSDNPKPARGSPFSFGPPKPPSTPSQSKQVPDTAQTKKKVTDTVKPKEIPHTARPSMDGAPSQDKPIPLMGLFAKPKEKEDTPENKQSPSPPSLDDKDNDTKVGVQVSN